MKHIILAGTMLCLAVMMPYKVWAADGDSGFGEQRFSNQGHPAFGGPDLTADEVSSIEPASGEEDPADTGMEGVTESSPVMESEETPAVTDNTDMLNKESLPALK